jgi:MFS family permease
MDALKPDPQSGDGAIVPAPSAAAGMPPAPAPLAALAHRRSDAWRALKHRNYRLFFSGQLISLVGTWMQTVAQSWLVYRLTGSELLLGAVGFTSQFPVLLFATVGGTVADRVSRRRILVITQCTAMALASVLATLTLTGAVQVWHVFVLGGCMGLVNAFDIPARQAFAVEMVGKADLQNAIALNSSVFNGARMIGPAIAGAMVAAVGEGWCFFANAVSFLAVIAGLLAMRIEPRPPARRGRLLGDVVQGFVYVYETPQVRVVLTLLAMASLMGMPYVVLMPVFAAEVLHSGPRGLGTLMSCAGIGALCAALTLAQRREVRGLERWVGRASLGFGTALVAFSSSRSFALSAVLLVGVGYAMMIQMASSNTLVQHMVPDHLRGRVMAVYSMMFMGMAPFGALLAGTLAERFGAPATVAFGGCVCITGALLLRKPLHRVRDVLPESLG